MPRFDVYVVPRSKRPGPDGRHAETFEIQSLPSRALEDLLRQAFGD